MKNFNEWILFQESHQRLEDFIGTDLIKTLTTAEDHFRKQKSYIDRIPKINELIEKLEEYKKLYPLELSINHFLPALKSLMHTNLKV